MLLFEGLFCYVTSQAQSSSSDWVVVVTQQKIKVLHTGDIRCAPAASPLQITLANLKAKCQLNTKSAASTISYCYTHTHQTDVHTRDKGAALVLKPNIIPSGQSVVVEVLFLSLSVWQLRPLRLHFVADCMLAHSRPPEQQEDGVFVCDFKPVRFKQVVAPTLWRSFFVAETRKMRVPAGLGWVAYT